MEEAWRDIDGFEGIYQVSNLGRVKSLERLSSQKHLIPEKILKDHPCQAGYRDISLYKDGKRFHKKVHRLVASAFCDNPRSLNEVDHIDTDKTNNRADNLRWVTHKENYENVNTKKNASKAHKGVKWKQSHYDKLCKKIAVYKGDELIHIFNSYKELDTTSKDIFGFTLWNVYVRRVINGLMDSYHGFTFKEIIA